MATPNNGTPVSNYVVSIEGPGLSTTRNTGTSTSATFQGAQSAAQYVVTVSARNSADRENTVVQWNSAQGSGTAVGLPSAPTSIAAQAASSANASGVSPVQVTWGAADAAGAPSVNYRAYAVQNGTNPPCTSLTGSPIGTTSGATDNDPGRGSQRYAVVADNGYFCNVGYTDSVTYTKATSTGDATVGVSQSGSDRWNASITAPSENVDHYVLTIGGTPVTLRPGATWTGVPSGSYNVATSFTLAACGGPGDGFCVPESGLSRGTAAAFDTTVAVTSAQRASPIVVTGPPAGSGVTARYTAHWYASTDGSGIEVPESWDAGTTAPSPPLLTNSVRVSVELRLNGTDVDVSGSNSDPTAVTDAPQPAAGG